MTTGEYCDILSKNAANLGGDTPAPTEYEGRRKALPYFIVCRGYNIGMREGGIPVGIFKDSGCDLSKEASAVKEGSRYAARVIGWR